MLKISLATAAMVLTAVGTASALEEPNAVSIDASSAVIDGNKISNISASINRPGYLVVHNNGAGAAPASLAHIVLQPGKTGDISIEAAAPIDPASEVTLMLHYETNDNNTYDFGPGSTDVDGPVKKGETVVNVPVGGKM